MTAVIRVIECSGGDAGDETHRLRERLSLRGDMVSARGRELTRRVFGADLTPRQVVERICLDVRDRGLEALLRYSRDLDDADLDSGRLRVSPAELDAAHRAVDPRFLAAVRRIRDNILRFQTRIKPNDIVVRGPDHELRLIHRPIRRVGLCIPGGAATYPSTILMTAVPAQVAGVKEIAVMAPPTAFGANHPNVLAVCRELQIVEVYRMGGAQGVAAFAYGVDGISPVDKIVGPGNLFVALAKQVVSGTVGIDMLAGPTELVVLADASANPHYLAADLISQAEHAPGASLLITWHAAFAESVPNSMNRQLAKLDRGELARESLQAHGAIILVADEAAGCRLANEFAPEHLQLATADPERTLSRIDNAGAVFLGHHTPVAIGDYIAGPSHTLPTSGTARFSSPLSVADFLKTISVISYGPKELAAVADDVRVVATVEGLTAHSHSVDIRLRSADDLAAEFDGG